MHSTPRRSPPAPSGLSVSGSTARSPALLGACGLCLLVLLQAACRDSPTDPLSGLVAGETGRAALSLELPLPVPVLEDPAAEGQDLVDRWRSSWEAPGLEGRVLREDLYPALGRLLAQARSDRALMQDLALLGAAVRRAGELDPEALPAFLEAGIERADASYRRGERAATAGNEAAGWAALLRGADALREVGPEAVARTAVDECEEKLRRISEDASYSEKERERIRHLVRGSRHALDDGDWVLAIRRAYYAEGLIRGNG